MSWRWFWPMLLTALVVLGSPFLTSGKGSAESFWMVLVPRAWTAALAGAGLAMAGAVLQSVMRNDLASPFTLGISAGATLGAALTVRFNWVVPLFGLSLLSPAILAALLGALLTTWLVDLIARRADTGTETLVLAGVGLSMLVNALVMALFLIDEAPRYTTLLFWTMGRLSWYGTGKLSLLAPIIVVGAMPLLRMRRELNLIALDSDSAQSLGLDLLKSRRVALLAVGLMSAGVVALVGPIGFVGLLAPHAARRLVGADQREVLPMAALLGASFLAFCDLLARSIDYPNELPIGVVTALIGSPAFLILLLRRPLSH